MFFWACTLLFLVVAERSIAAEITNVTMTLEHDWDEASKFILSVRMTESVARGWRMSFLFSKPVAKIQMWRASLVSFSKEHTFYAVKNMYFNENLAKGELLTMALVVYKIRKDEKRANVSGLFKPGNEVPTFAPIGEASTIQPVTNLPSGNSTGLPSKGPTVNSSGAPSLTTPSSAAPTGPPSPGPFTEPQPSAIFTPSGGPTLEPTLGPGCPSNKPFPPSPITHYNYNEVLRKSVLFYEAQRSGKLPVNNRVLWRKDSHLDDRGENGEDLTGGWYDAGDYVKFGFPMASSVTVLAWGLIEYRDAYEAAGELSHILDSIKWPLDYFMKAHTKKFEFYGQVGDGHADHAYWGRPEDQTLARPSYRITPSKPGADLAAETAAALAAASMSFRKLQPDYAKQLLQHAEELYEFSDNNRGRYSDSIPAAASFYPSSDYKDELCWGAAWLYRATSKKEYLKKAQKYYTDFGLNKKAEYFNWDNKKAGVQLLLAKLTGNATYASDLQQFLDGVVPVGDVSYTPEGLAWSDHVAPNSLSANTAFLALVASDLRIRPDVYRRFAIQQIHYMLGDSGQSFVIGFGANSPQNPRHRGSSCPLAPAPCTWENYNEPGPNPHSLLGALVAGPDPSDGYVDDRTNAAMNQVTVHYNAGFQSALAGLKRLQMMGKF